jgi:hypothetical protein
MLMMKDSCSDIINRPEIQREKVTVNMPIMPSRMLDNVLN